MKANLLYPVVGTVVNLDGNAYEIKKETGRTLECFPGGRGVREVVLSLVASRPLTRGEIRELALIPAF